MYIPSNYRANSPYQYVNPFSSKATAAYNAAANAPLPSTRADSIANSKNGGMSTASSKFLAEYSSQFTALKASAQKLSSYSSTSAFKSNSATSSNTEVASAAVNYAPKKNATYKVDVQQLAAEQKNTSLSMESSAKTSITSGSFTIGQGGKQATIDYNMTGKSNQEALSSLAGSINASGLGLTATVTQKDGKSSLLVSGKQTGAANGFELGADTGNLLSLTGADEISQQAKDALYTVENTTDKTDPVRMSSSGNNVAVDSYRVSATLKKTGSTTISLGADPAAIVSSAQDLAKQFNATVKLLNDNATTEGSAVQKQLYQLLQPPTSEKSMNSIGISYDKSGQLKVDAKMLEEATAKDPKNVQYILDKISSGVSSAATKSLNTPSVSLVANNSPTASPGFDPQNMGSYYNDNKSFFKMMNSLSMKGIYTGDYIGNYMNSKA